MADPRTPTHTTSDDVYAKPIRVAHQAWLAKMQWVDGDEGQAFTAAICAAVDAARADGEHAATARIVAALRAEFSKHSDGWEIAGMIERGEFDDVAATND